MQKKYLAELKVTGKAFSNQFYSNYASIYSLPEKAFISKIDSARKQFQSVLNTYSNQLDKGYVRGQEIEIKYYFDKLLIDHPVNHDNYVGSNTINRATIPQKLKNNLVDFNDPSLLANADFTNYVKAFFAYQTELELKKPAYKNTDNRQLKAAWKLIPRFISNQPCRTFWRSYYLYNHIENKGIKNIGPIYNEFRSTCKDTTELSRIHTIYAEDSIGRLGHLIKTYKKVGAFDLDMHLFLPDGLAAGDKKPVIVFFHGGSWSEGKPDWFFYSCENYAKKGWVACSVEYRISGRQGTLPFDAVMDARSAIRWLREHAAAYNIDTNRIVASGNSAGGHLALCTVLANQWNEKTDNLAFGAAANLLLINAGVYDLTDQNNSWIRKGLKDKNIVKQISPVYLIEKKLPPTLIIHGTNDQNVPYASAERFVTETKQSGNTTIQFEPLQGAGHFIWFDQKYSAEVSRLRGEFLVKWGY